MKQVATTWCEPSASNSCCTCLRSPLVWKVRAMFDPAPSAWSTKRAVTGPPALVGVLDPFDEVDDEGDDDEAVEPAVDAVAVPPALDAGAEVVDVVAPSAAAEADGSCRAQAATRAAAPTDSAPVTKARRDTSRGGVGTKVDSNGGAARLPVTLEPCQARRVEPPANVVVILLDSLNRHLLGCY